jgi:hypothetical protein
MTESLRPGDRASIEHLFTREAVAAFVELSGDDNPIHRDLEAARVAGFEREVVHGVLVLSLISRCLAGSPDPHDPSCRAAIAARVADRNANVEILPHDKPVVQLARVETDVTVPDGQATVLVRPLTGTGLGRGRT